MPYGETERLRDWMQAVGIGSGPLDNVTRLTGGTQNLLFRFRMGDEEFVLRRPACNARPEASTTIAREARVLAALHGSAVPHARFRGLCTDLAVLGAPFLITDAVDGFNAAVALSEQAAQDCAVRHKMGIETVDGIVALAAVDYRACGLEDFGRLEQFIERQRGRWTKQLTEYRSYSSWPGPEELGGVTEVGDWLDKNRPSEWRPGLMHGDYHLGNVLFTSEGALAAILDWELAALGDPYLDLGRLLAAWPDEEGHGPLSLKVSPWQGFPGREELIERYSLGTGRPTTDLLWFEVLACFKLGIILEGSFARACAGLAAMDVGQRLHRSAVALFERATVWIEERG